MPNNTLFVGHSLVGTTMPQMLTTLLAARTPGSRADYQVINGAPLMYNWAHGATAEGVNARAVLPSGDYATLILTEAVPLAGHIRWDNTYGYATAYYDLAVAANPAARVMIYETWDHITTDAAWRASLSSNQPLWQGIAAHVNAARSPGQPAVALVPAGQAMARLYDSIAAGQGMGLTSIRQLFLDDIHLKDAGSYFIAMVQYAAITRVSPVGLTSALHNPWGVAYTGWTLHQANLFQHIAWEAASPAGPTAPRLLKGSSASQILTAGSGDDRIYGGGGSDTLQGGAGRDLITGGSGKDRIDGGSGDDWLYSGGGRDRLLGNLGNDRLFGGTASESLYGGPGNDQISAGAGNDWLNGGSGADILFGAAGADSFAFAKGSGADHIRDFHAAEGDRLALSHGLWAGSLTAAQIVQRFAHVTAAGVVLDFAAGDTLTLDGISSLAGLSLQINIL